jgi:nucleoside-diphosphate kinase
MKRTLAIIKPDAVRGRLVGKILQQIEETGLRILALRLVHLSEAQAEGFYAVHRGRPFFRGLTEYISSGPSGVMALEGEDAIGRWRDLMGRADPVRTAAGTVRREFTGTIERNVTHGSDAQDTAAFEIAYFFSGIELGEPGR